MSCQRNRPATCCSACDSMQLRTRAPGRDASVLSQSHGVLVASANSCAPEPLSSGERTTPLSTPGRPDMPGSRGIAPKGVDCCHMKGGMPACCEMSGRLGGR